MLARKATQAAKPTLEGVAMLKGRAEAAIKKVAGAMNALNQGVKETASGITPLKIGTQNLKQNCLKSLGSRLVNMHSIGWQR